MKPYSNRIRKYVFDAIDLGTPLKKVCALYNISLATLSTWIRQRKDTNSIARLRGAKRSYILNDDELRTVVAKDIVEQGYPRPCKQLADMFNMTEAGIFYALRRLKIMNHKELSSCFRRDREEWEDEYKYEDEFIYIPQYRWGQIYGSKYGFTFEPRQFVQRYGFEYLSPEERAR
jgi:transposase